MGSGQCSLRGIVLLIMMMMLLLLGGAVIPTAGAEGPPGFSAGGGGSASLPRFEIVDRDAAGFTLRLQVQDLARDRVTIGGVAYEIWMIPGGQLHGRPGEPALPAFARYVEIPPGAAVRPRVLETEQRRFDGVRLAPMQAEETACFELAERVYAADRYLGDEVVSVGSPAVLRGRRVVAVTFRPVHYNPARGEVRLLDRIDLRLEFTPGDRRNNPRRADLAGPVLDGRRADLAAPVLDPRRADPAAPAIGSGHAVPSSRVVAGWQPGGVLSPWDDEAGMGPSPTDMSHSAAGMGPSPSGTRPLGPASHRGTWLIISADDPDVDAALAPLLSWRRRMGYDVVHATTTQTGATAEQIKAWIQQAYDTWESPPAYVVLVGDAGGAFGLPTFFEPWSGDNGPGDHPYAQLDGDDLLPDAYIGRLSAEDIETLTRIVYKIVTYETTPYIEDPDWFGRVCLTGDPSTSGATCIQIQQWLKDKLLDLGYTQIDTVFTEPYRSQTLASLDQGTTFFGYRGFAGVSGISVGDILGLQNGPRLTFGVVLTCVTGDWVSGTAFNEAFLRGGIGTGTPTGGIGGIATATGGTHTRYNNCFYGGIAYGLFWDEDYRIGAAHARGKVEMVLNYGEYEWDQAARYCYWNTLMGDPVTELWSGFPQEIVASYEAELPVGATAASVVVHDAWGEPVEGAWVHVYAEDRESVGVATNADGQVTLPIDGREPGDVRVTVTGHNLYPHRGNFTIVEPALFVGLQGYELDDGPTPPAQGNGDGVINPGETIALALILENYGSQSAEDVQLSATCEDDLVTVLAGGPIDYGTLAPGQQSSGSSPVVLAFDERCPHGYPLRLELAIESGAQEWPALLELEVTAADLVYVGHELVGVGGVLDPGETGELIVELGNRGAVEAGGPVSAVLLSCS